MRVAHGSNDTTAQYCAGFFFSGSEVSESLKSNDQKQVNTVVHPPFLPDNSGLSVSQEVLYAVGVVTTRRSRRRGVSPR